MAMKGLGVSESQSESWSDSSSALARSVQRPAAPRQL